MRNVRLMSSPSGTKNNPVNSKNLVADYSAVGDGQRQTGMLSTISGSPARTLIVASGIFQASDVGKSITLWNGNYGGTGGFNSTIATYSSPTQVILSTTSPASFSNVSTEILWGTDNTTAFTNYRTWARTQTNPASPPVLLIPDGNYVCGMPSGGLHDQVLNSARVTGLSGTAANCKLMQKDLSEFRFGGQPGIVANRGLANNNGGVIGNSVRLVSGTVGSTTITLSNPAGTDLGGATYGSRVVVGRACLLGAYDMQSLNDSDYGYPPNNYFFEWNSIVGYNPGTGVVTLENPLTQDYKSTYPQWCPDDTSFASGHLSGADSGGPFTMWIAPDGYNNTITLENFTVDNTRNQSACHRRHWVGNNLIMNGPGLYPTQNDTVTLNNSVYPQQLEIDKMTNQVTWNNCTIRKLQQQSASPNKMTINGGTIDSLELCKFTEVNNTAFTNEAGITLGVSAFGRCNRAVFTNCTGIKVIQRGGAETSGLGGTSGPNPTNLAASTFYEFNSGVLRFLKTRNDAGAWNGNSGQENPTRALVPGTWVLFDDKSIDQVTDVYEDGTYCYIQFANTTSWPFATVNRIKNHPCPDLTFTGCTGTAPELDDFQLAPARSPAYSYSKRTIVAGATAATNDPTMNARLFGKFVSEKLNVTTPYVGAGTLTFNDSQFKNRTYLKRSDWTSSATFGSTINMKIGGERVIRAATTPTGAQTGDSLMDMTTPGEVNFQGTAASNTIFSANVSNGETPTITVEYIMDQGIPAP